MGNKLVTLIILSSLYILFTVSDAGATITKDRGLGLSAYPWMYDSAESYIYENPAFISKFKNEIMFERVGVDASGFNMGGILLNPVGGLNFAVIAGYPVNSAYWNGRVTSTVAPGAYTVDREGFFYKDLYVSGSGVSEHKYKSGTGNLLDLLSPNGTEVNTVNTILRSPLTQQSVQAILGYDFGAYNIAVKFAYSNKNNSAQTGPIIENYSFSSSQYDIGVGMDFKFTDAVTMDAGASLILYDLTDTYSTNVITGSMKTNNAMDISAFLRLNIKADQFNKLHFKASYTNFNHSTLGYWISASQNFNDYFSRLGNFISFGLSDELRVSKYFAGFAGVNMDLKLLNYNFYGADTTNILNNLDRYTNSIMSIQVPFVIGIELNLGKYFDAGLGFSYTIYGSTAESGNNITGQGATNYAFARNTQTTTSTDINIGISIKVENFRLDWLMNINLFLRGPDFVSGYAVSNVATLNSDAGTPWSMAFAASYNFDALLIPLKKKTDIKADVPAEQKQADAKK